MGRHVDCRLGSVVIFDSHRFRRVSQYQSAPTRVSAVDAWFSFHRLYADFVLSSFDDAAEIRKRTKYTNIAESHIFQPIAFETTGAAGPSTRAFFKQLCSYLIYQVYGRLAITGKPPG